MQTPSQCFDTLIVGGGPAGLGAALLLGRSLRHVLLCDDGRPRNASSQMLNGYPSRDGIDPARFLEICRRELVRYDTVEQMSAKVAGLERKGKGFVATLEDAAPIAARTVLLSSGIQDELPCIEGLSAFFGKSIHTCPYCHGWECRNQPLAVIGSNEEEAELAIELLQWSKDIILCSNGTPLWNRRTESRLEATHVRVDDRRIVAFVGRDHHLRGIQFDDGSLLPRKAAFLSPSQKQRTRLAQQLGCKITRKGSIKCDENRATRVRGVYTAGNAARGKQLVIIAAAEGTLAGIAINDYLTEES